jgi:voltage-gated potassium channel Kch
VSGPVPWSLEVARLLAPAVVVYTAARALLEIFRDQIQLFRARLAKHHVIICGLGRKGHELARSFRQAGYPVVAIERDREEGKIAQARGVGAIVLNGDAADRESLRKTRVDRASYLFSVCGDDSVNAAVAVHSRQLAKDLEGRGLTCFIHVDDSELTRLLREREITTQQADAFRLESFNIQESGTRAMLSAFPPFAPITTYENAGPRLLVVGAGRAGQSVVVQVAKQWIFLRGKNGGRAFVTLVDGDADSVGAMLLQRYPAMNDAVSLDLQPIEPESAQFHQADFLRDSQGTIRFERIYVCLDADELSLASALSLRQKLRGQGIPIVIQLANDSGLTELMGGEGGDAAGFDDLHAFGLIEHTCTPDLPLGGTHEVLARAIHRAYLHERISSGETAQSNASLMPWDALSEGMKDSNRRQADHLG